MFASLNMTRMALARFNRATLQRITSSFINFDHRLSISIDIPAIHAVCIKWQSDLAFFIDGDQAAGAAELFHCVQSHLRRFLQFHSAIFDQR